MKINKSLLEASISLNLTLTNKSLGISLDSNCTFWQTKYHGVYVTDYNLNFDHTMPVEEANLFNSKKLFAICGFGRFIYFSAEMLKEVDFFENELIYFKNEILKR